MIGKAIESVISQSITDWELIIVDDGSIDTTKKVVESFVEKESRIKYVFQKNAERSAARNNGIKKASGNWICFLDSDDSFHKDHLKWLKELIIENNHKKAIYFTGLSKNKFDSSKQKYIYSKNKIEFLLLNSFATGRACIHNSIIKEHKFNENIRIGEDMELWTRIANKFSVLFHNKKTYIQFFHELRSVNLGSDLENLKTLKLIFKTSKICIDRKIKNRVLSNAYFNIFKWQFKNEESFKSVLNLIISILKDIRNNQTKHKTLLLISILFSINSKLITEYK